MFLNNVALKVLTEQKFQVILVELIQDRVIRLGFMCPPKQMLTSTGKEF